MRIIIKKCMVLLKWLITDRKLSVALVYDLWLHGGLVLMFHGEAPLFLLDFFSQRTKEKEEDREQRSMEKLCPSELCNGSAQPRGQGGGEVIDK